MKKEQIEEFSRKLSADGNQHIMFVLCGDNVVAAMEGTCHRMSLYLAGVALYDDDFRTVFEEAIKMYEKGKENGK